MMKLGIKIFFIAIFVCALIFSAVYLFLFFQGKNIIIKQLEALTQKKVNIGYFNITPPLNLQIKNLDIAGLVKADSVSVSPSILGFLTGNIALNEVKVVKPELFYERAAPEAAGLTIPGTPRATAETLKQKKPLRLIVKRVIIKDGKLNIIDHTVGENGIKITIKDINFNLANLYAFPRSVITNFELKGKIPWQEGQEEGKIEAQGWLNFFKKNMEATLKIEDIDGVYLYPYYSNWVDLEKARIEKAKLNFTSEINGVNNNITAQCHLELTDIVRKPRPSDETAEKAERIADVVLDVFRALNQGKIVLDFTIRTKMDRPQFGFGDIKTAFEDKLAQGTKGGKLKAEDILLVPVKVLEGAVKGATELSRAVIDGAFSVGNELKKAVEDTFKRDKTQ